eukprot:Nk52_evm71s210 gene=Nk52_evmTU71s210
MSDAGSDDFEEEGPNLGTYDGERNENYERHGFGKTTLPNGDQYEGYYVSGKRHGAGTYKFKNNSRYIGEYVENQKHGNGTFYFPDGSKYEGSWVNNERSGYGSYTYENGDVYEGEWENGTRHGQGSYSHKETGVTYKGTWAAGKREGRGEIEYNNYKYIGTFANDLPVGEGKFVFHHGTEQLGEYVVTDSTPDETGNPIPVATKWMGVEFKTCEV